MAILNDSVCGPRSGRWRKAEEAQPGSSIVLATSASRWLPKLGTNFKV